MALPKVPKMLMVSCIAPKDDDRSMDLHRLPFSHDENRIEPGHTCGAGRRVLGIFIRAHPGPNSLTKAFLVLVLWERNQRSTVRKILLVAKMKSPEEGEQGSPSCERLVA